MNLIEQLGGYEKSKSELELKEQDSILQCCASVTANMIRSAMLEYRRQHNIYEVNDLIVFDNTKQYCALLPDDIMTYESMFDTDARVRQGGRFFAVSFAAIRHATDEEIAAGKRL